MNWSDMSPAARRQAGAAIIGIAIILLVRIVAAFPGVF